MLQPTPHWMVWRRTGKASTQEACTEHRLMISNIIPTNQLPPPCLLLAGWTAGCSAAAYSGDPGPAAWP